MTEVSFGEWLKRQRNGRGLTQKRMAHQIGCAVITLRKIESEERRPSAQIAERLAEILDVPEDERSAFQRFARGDWRAMPTQVREEYPWRASTEFPRTNLPSNTTSLIGREKEIANVREYLQNADIRLVTLIGPPGIGKTRLGIETAREALNDFPDGIFWVALASLEDPSLVAFTIVQALGYVEAKNLTASQQLVNGIGEKQILFVLDNCEHLIQAVASLVPELLSSCPHLKILATSRESLRVSGEWLCPVPPLDVPQDSLSIDVKISSEFPALTLFAERARAVRPNFELNAENVQTVASICTQLDGIPLAIELIAARNRIMSPESLLARLNDRFVLSADGMRAVSARQKTLNQAISWSYDLLTGDEQQLFACLSIFSGGFSLEAVESVFSGTFTTISVPDLIMSLLDKSLIQRASDTAGEPRYFMLMTIQQFARERLRDTKEVSEIHDKHLDYFLDLAEQANHEIHGPDQVEWMNRLEKELDNFRTALEWGLSDQKMEYVLRLLVALGWTWIMRGYTSEFHNWFDQVSSLYEITAYPALYARLLNYIGIPCLLSGKFQEALSVLNESQAIWSELGTDGEQGAAEAFTLLGMVARTSAGDEKTAKNFFERSLDLYKKHNDQWGMALVIFNLGWIAKSGNDDALALSLYEQSLNLYRQLGDLWGTGLVSQALGALFLKQGKYEKAGAYFEHELEIDERLQFKDGMAMVLNFLGNIHRLQGDYEQAGEYYKKSLAMCQEYNMVWEGGVNLYNCGILALQQNDYSLAKHFFTNQFKSTRRMSENIVTYDFLISSAAIAAGTDQHTRTATLYGAAQALSETTDYRIPHYDFVEFDRHIQLAREALGDEAFGQLVEQGRDMMMEQAVAFALEINDV